MILNILQKGENNAKSLTELRHIVGGTERDIHRLIESLRRNGSVICSSEKGYFLPETEGELRAYVHKEHSRAKSIFRNTRAAAVALAKWGDSDK